MIYAQSKNKRKRVAVLAPILLLAPFIVILLLYLLLGADSIPAWVIPLPLHLTALYIAVFPHLKHIPFLSSHTFDQTAWHCCLLTAILYSMFLALLSFKLAQPGSTKITWNDVITPLIIIHAWLLLWPIIVYSLRSCFFEYVPRLFHIYSARYDRDIDKIGVGLISLLSGLLAIPLISLELLVAKTLDGERDYPWSQILIPVYLLSGTAVIIAAVFNGILIAAE